MTLLRESWEDVSRGSGGVETPMFDGEDLLAWVLRVEMYFDINFIAEHEKLEVTVAYLQGKALNWYYWMETRAPLNSWIHFKMEQIRCFHDLLFASKQEFEKRNKENKPAEAEEKSETQMEDDGAKSEKKEDDDAETEEEEDGSVEPLEGENEPIAEQTLKLRPVSLKEKVEEIFSNNPREKMKTEAFEVQETAPNTSIDIRHTYVAAEETKRGRDAERARARRWGYDKKDESRDENSGSRDPARSDRSRAVSERRAREAREGEGIG